ncbi:DUF4249 domain-containing protein [Proteiniphilum sp.]|nr:DUF4249 domain-containing protein [Proteiniphilum sp.]MEA4917335.1 DUF4249 domain-containing protein [Proteiniphilum sp.]
MQRNRLYTLFLSIFTFCLISCEKDIEFKGEIADPLLVMNSIVTPDSIITVHLSQSRFTIGDWYPVKNISNGTVSVWVNGILKEQLSHTTNGTYEGSYLPQPGDQIKIEAKADGFDQVYSQTIVPKKPTVTVADSTVTVKKEEYTSPYDPRMLIKTTYRHMSTRLILKDAAGEENYYFIKATRNYLRNGEIFMTKITDLKLSELLKNSISGNNDLFEDLYGDDWEINRTDNLFSDMLVNGKDIIFDFTFIDKLETASYYEGNKVDDGRGNMNATVELVIEIAEVSKDLYQYVISGYKSEGSYDTPFIEPVQVHSNIVNGIGILGSCNTYRFISGFDTNYIPERWEVI